MPKDHDLKVLEALRVRPQERPIVSSSTGVKRRDRLGGLIHEYRYAA
jgi:hypothetical protein